MAGQLPGQLGPALIDAAREAFTQGLHLAAAISAVGSIGLAILVATCCDVFAGAPMPAINRTSTPTGRTQAAKPPTEPWMPRPRSREGAMPTSEP